MDKYFLRTNNGDKTEENKTGSKKLKPTNPSKRKYHEEYIEFAFVSSESDNSQPVCLLCSATLSNEAMVPSKLKRHFEKNHPEYVKKPRCYFENMHSKSQKQAKRLKTYCTVPENAQIASFKIAQLLARKKKPHSDAENIILPSLEIAVEAMVSGPAVDRVKLIPLSSDTIARRIQDMSDDIDQQLKEHFLNNQEPILKLWALQIDESTDISNKAQLIAYLRVVMNQSIQNQFFFCSELKETTTGQDIFELVDQNIESKGLKWENCVSICTDGAPAMQGRKKGFVAHVLKINPMVEIVHCMIHREVLVSKALPEKLSQAMSEVVKVVNYVKSNALRTRIFASLCEAMDSDYKGLLYHTEVRWLSKGKVLDRVIYLRVEIISFFETEDTDDFFSFMTMYGGFKFRF